MAGNYYESEGGLAEYLLLHYGWHEEVLPYGFGPKESLDFPWRCAEVLLRELPEKPDLRALDLGCAVGRSSFDLARRCREVVGVDTSERFIRAARELRRTGELSYQRKDEGDLRTALVARVPDGIYREHVSFHCGDACAVPPEWGTFDAVLLANLLDRLPKPRRCLEELGSLVKPGGMVLITTPGTWLEEYTPKAEWLGGYERDGREVTTEEGIQEAMQPYFRLMRSGNMPFLIREHERKFQWGVARMMLWKRYGGGEGH